MKLFKTIKDAIEYKTHCPFCKSKIEISVPAHYTDKYITIERKGVKVIANINNNQIVQIIEDRNISSGPTVFILECNTCERYSYSIGINMINTNVISSIYLLAEFIAANKSINNYYEINNNYKENTTHYYQDNKADITLPLVDFNFNDPLKTLKKIKTLITFL